MKNKKNKLKYFISIIAIMVLIFSMGIGVYAGAFAEDTNYEDTNGYYYLTVTTNGMETKYKVVSNIGNQFYNPKSDSDDDYNYKVPTTLELISGPNVLSLVNTPITYSDKQYANGTYTDSQRQYGIHYQFKCLDGYDFSADYIELKSYSENPAKVTNIDFKDGVFELVVSTNAIGMTNYTSENDRNFYHDDYKFSLIPIDYTQTVIAYFENINGEYTEGNKYIYNEVVSYGSKFDFNSMRDFKNNELTNSQIYETGYVTEYVVLGDKTSTIYIPRKTYTITCEDYLEDGTYLGTQSTTKTYRYGATASGSDWGTTRDGYSYIDSQTLIVTENATIKRTFSETSYGYTINHYYRDSKTTATYTFCESERKAASPGTLIKMDSLIKNYNGYSFEGANVGTSALPKPNVLSTTEALLTENNYVINLYYIKDTAIDAGEEKLTIDMDGGTASFTHGEAFEKVIDFNETNKKYTIGHYGRLDTGIMQPYTSSAILNNFAYGIYYVKAIGAAGGDITSGTYSAKRFLPIKIGENPGYADLNVYTSAIAGGKGGAYGQGNIVLFPTDNVTITVGKKGESATPANSSGSNIKPFYPVALPNVANTDERATSGHGIAACSPAIEGQAYLNDLGFYYGVTGYGGEATTVTYPFNGGTNSIVGGGGGGAVLFTHNKQTEIETIRRTGFDADTGFNIQQGNKYVPVTIKYFYAINNDDYECQNLTMAENTHTAKLQLMNWLNDFYKKDYPISGVQMSSPAYTFINQTWCLPEYNPEIVTINGKDYIYSLTGAWAVRDGKVFSNEVLDKMIGGGILFTASGSTAAQTFLSFIGEGTNSVLFGIPGYSGSVADSITTAFTDTINSTNTGDGQAILYCNWKNITLPTPTREGYIFKGYELVSKSDPQTILIYNEYNDGMYHLHKYPGEATVKAIWEKNNYDVVYTKGLTNIYNPDFSEVWNINIAHTVHENTFKGRSYLVNYDTTSSIPVDANGNLTSSGLPTTVSSKAGNLKKTGYWKLIQTQYSNLLNSSYRENNVATNLTTAKNVAILEALWASTEIKHMSEPALYGYDFVGWTKTKPTNGINTTNALYTYNTMIEPDTTAFNLTLYANWKPLQGTLIFDYNAGSYEIIDNRNPVWVESSTIDLMEGSSEKERKVTFDQKYGAFPTPTMPGYEFLGWATTQNGKTTNGQSSIVDVNVLKDTIMRTLDSVTYYAIWKPSHGDNNNDDGNGNPSVIFDYSENESNLTENYNNTIHKSHEIANNDEIDRNLIYDRAYSVINTGNELTHYTKTLPKPTLKGWTFIGWNLVGSIPYANNGYNSVEYDNTLRWFNPDNSVSDSTQVKTWERHTLKAIWRANPYNIITHPNIDSLEERPELTVTYNTYYDVMEQEIPVYNEDIGFTIKFDTNGGNILEDIKLNWKQTGWLYNPNQGSDNTTKIVDVTTQVNLYNTLKTYNPKNMTIIVNGVKNNNFKAETIIPSGYKWIETTNTINTKNLTDIRNGKVHLYATWNTATTTLPYPVKENAEFLGWFTVDQNNPESYTSADSYEKYCIMTPEEVLEGKEISFAESIVLYAWWNKKPVFIDILEGEFFEGQTVTYNDLLNMVTVQDYEDDLSKYKDAYLEAATAKLNEYYQKEIENCDIALWGVTEKMRILQEEGTAIYGDAYYNLMEDLNKSQQLLTEQRNQLQYMLMKELEELKDVELTLLIKEIHYLSDDCPTYQAISALDKSSMTGDEYAVKVEEAKELCNCNTKKEFDTTNSNNGIYQFDTSTKNIGNVIVSYIVTDNGIKCGDVILDPITMEYDRTYVINYNYCPLVSTHNLTEYWDTDIESLSKMILDSQGAEDSEDTQNNVPWWIAYNDFNGEDSVLFDTNNKNTHVKLNHDNLVITGVNKIEFNPIFEYETDYDGNYINAETIALFKETWLSPEVSNKGAFSDDNGVYDKAKWVDAMYEDAVATGLWKYISTIEITIDTHDQWGKYASNRVSNKGKLKGITTKPQIIPGYPDTEILPDIDPSGDEPPYDDPSTYNTPIERTVTIAIINPDIEVDEIESIRYINKDYIVTLQNTDWDNRESVNKLLRMFALQKMQNSNDWVDVVPAIDTTYTTALGKTITVSIYDYGVYTETEEAWQTFLATYGLTEPSGYER